MNCCNTCTYRKISTRRLRDSLAEGNYRVHIGSRLFDGELNYGEILLPGREEKEVMFSTYICHPSMANNELSGPIVCLELAKWLARCGDRRYSYRFVFIPETIGSITYLSRHLEELQRKVVAGFNITCIGDPAPFSYVVWRQPGRPGGAACPAGPGSGLQDVFLPGAGE